MMELYDQASSILFPSGKTWSADELKDHERYRVFFTRQTVLDKHDDGTLRAFWALDELARTYGVAEPDPQAAFEAVVAKMEEQAAKAAEASLDLAEVHARLDEQDEALMELAALLA